MSDKATAICKRLESLRATRQPHEQAWKECFDYSFPERGSGLQSSVVLPQDAQTKKNRILDDTAADSARILSAALVSGNTPSSSIWLGLDAGNYSEDEGSGTDESRWLDQAARFIFDNIHAANFDAQAFECCIDIVPAGWFVLYIDEAEGGGYHFEQWPIAQCFVSASKPGGVVDTIFREVELTVDQVVTEYGIDNVSPRVARLHEEEKYEEKVTVLHAIYPRKMYVVGGKRAVNLPFSSCHVEVHDKHLLRESGYHEFPCCVPRWMLTPGTPYGTGPMSAALGSIRTINDIKAMELAALDMAMSGMYIATDDGVLNPKNIKIGPRKVIIANSTDSMKELKSSARFDVAFSSEERLQATIRKIMLADQLQPQDGPAMTATEVHVRVQLIRQLLGPIYGRLQAEYLQPLVKRCFGLAYRAGVLGVAPESLQGKIYTVKYISPLARSQRLEDVTAMDRMEQSLMAEAQVDPGVLDVYDFDEAARQRGKFLGVPVKVMRAPRDVEKMRAARVEQQKQAQAQAQMAQLGQTAGEAIINKAAA
jgi:hypothetical protein